MDVIEDEQSAAEVKDETPDEGLCYVMIRLEARLQPNIGFTSRRVLAVFTR